MRSGRPKPLVNGYSSGPDEHDDVTDNDRDVTYRPVDFCIPVGPIFNFITGQLLATCVCLCVCAVVSCGQCWVIVSCYLYVSAGPVKALVITLLLRRCCKQP